MFVKIANGDEQALVDHLDSAEPPLCVEVCLVDADQIDVHLRSRCNVKVCRSVQLVLLMLFRCSSGCHIGSFHTSVIGPSGCDEPELRPSELVVPAGETCVFGPCPFEPETSPLGSVDPHSTTIRI